MIQIFEVEKKSSTEPELKEDAAVINELKKVAQKLKSEKNRMMVEEMLDVFEKSGGSFKRDDYFFNDRFQKLLQMEDCYDKSVLLAEHTSDFVYAVFHSF